MNGGWTDGWMGMDGQMGRWMVGQMSGWMHGWMGGWMNDGWSMHGMVRRFETCDQWMDG